ncbi:MAG: hypothetical protein SCH70_12640 [Candidatus Methanoperedens sp.]|nr:hypothetical protein [Candidatus Methanoperedens sp.]
MRALKHKKESQTNRTSKKNATISVYVRQGLKSLHTVLLPDEENGKCGIVKYRAEFPDIGNHSPKRK